MKIELNEDEVASILHDYFKAALFPTAKCIYIYIYIYIARRLLN